MNNRNGSYRVGLVRALIYVLCALLCLPIIHAGSLDELNQQQEEFLPVEEAFVLEYSWASPGELALRWQMPDGYYLYRDQIRAQGEGFAEPIIPAGKRKTDEYFGEVEVYYRELQVRVPLLPDAPDSLELRLGWQGCADAGLCYPPQERILQLPRPGSSWDGGGIGEFSQAPDQQLASQLASSGLLWNLLVFFALGLLLALTPCVLPMVPILSSLLVGAGEISRLRSFALSGVYVLAMSLAYTAAGVAAALTGANLQVALQNPWALGVFATLMVLLSLSMFGLYEIQVPARLQTWLSGKSNQQQGGSLVGAALMGLLSALIVGPCVAPPLVGALIYISHSGNVFIGGGALFALGLGMGAPLLLVGGTLGNLLPRVGVWMESVKWLFGFMLLGLAIWFVERVLPADIGYALWGALLCLVSAWLLRPTAEGGAEIWLVIRRALGIAAVLWALLWFAMAAGVGSTSQPRLVEHGFTDVYSLAEVQAVVDEQDKPVLLDFYADWCVECKQMEADVFPHPDVQGALQGWVALRVDVTANDAPAKAILKHYSVLGPPTLIFLKPDGNERRSLRIVGVTDASGLAKRLQTR